MRKDNKNEQIVEGRLYEFDLSKKTVKNEKSRNYGIEFINGSVSIATNEDGTNVLKVHYTFEPPVNSKSQTTNNKFSALVRIMESGKTWLKDGKEAATKIRIVGSLGLNDFYPNGGDELRSQKIIKGGFIDFLAVRTIGRLLLIDGLTECHHSILLFLRCLGAFLGSLPHIIQFFGHFGHRLLTFCQCPV